MKCGIYIMSKNTISGSAPLQNGNAPCSACTVKPVLQFKSASEVVDYKKRQTVSSYYTKSDNVFPIKNRYGYMATTFKKAVVASSTMFPDGTCCNNGQLTGRSDGKDTPAFLYNKFNAT
jgi:hypothetical protein